MQNGFDDDVEFETKGKEVTLSAPKLSALDKLYVRAYLSTLDHVKAHRVVAPTLKSHHATNTFSKKESVQFHISLGLQEAMEAFELTPEKIISKLYKEATREGLGSNHAARVTALSLLGKQFGLFQEKKESNVPTINIVTYKVEDSTRKDSLPSLKKDTLELTESKPNDLFEVKTYEICDILPSNEATIEDY
jgi:hypothetical protein